jgi:hypothetical protein
MHRPARRLRTLQCSARFKARRQLCVIAPLLVLAIAPAARADLYEGFNYPPGPSLGGGTIGAGSLADPSGTLATSANHLTGGNGVERLIAPFQTIGTPGTDVWISWLQRRDRDVPGFHGLNVMQRKDSGGSTTYTGLYFIGEPGSGAGNGSYVIGSGDDNTVVSSGVPAAPNQTAFLVAHLQFQDGNDLATLYVNPTPGTQPPAGGFTFSGRDMPAIRPYLAFMGSGTGVTYDFDELRIGSSYAAVAPAVPEPPAAPVAALLVVATAAATRRPRRRRLVV